MLLSKPLMDLQELTKQERNKAFWHGFHPDDRAAMESRLIAKHPNQPKRRAFDYEEVLEVAKAVLTGPESFLPQRCNKGKKLTKKSRKRDPRADDSDSDSDNNVDEDSDSDEERDSKERGRARRSAKRERKWKSSRRHS